MKNPQNDDIRNSLESLVQENKKLKRQNLWLSVFVIVVFVIQLYNLVYRYFKPE